MRLFQFAKQKGTYLIVALDTDERVSNSKGTDRPYNRLEDRMEMLRSIKYIDEVLCFDTDASLECLVENIKPDIMIVGGDWKGKKVIGSEHAKRVEYFSRIDEYSTTKILENYKDQRKIK
jgi:D-beta-D-heptose 7-phosphate kinase/D-beta-D-heptose 1-phosphate adenosyltransferase